MTAAAMSRCEECGQPYVPRRWRNWPQRFCSGKCRGRNQYQRAQATGHIRGKARNSAPERQHCEAQLELLAERAARGESLFGPTEETS